MGHMTTSDVLTPMMYLSVALWLIQRVQQVCLLGTNGRVFYLTELIVTKWCAVSLHLRSISSMICSLPSLVARKIIQGHVIFFSGSLPRSGHNLSLNISQCLKSSILSLITLWRSYTALLHFAIGWNLGN